MCFLSVCGVLHNKRPSRAEKRGRLHSTTCNYHPYLLCLWLRLNLKLIHRRHIQHRAGGDNGRKCSKKGKKSGVEVPSMCAAWHVRVFLLQPTGTGIQWKSDVLLAETDAVARAHMDVLYVHSQSYTQTGAHLSV